MADFVAVLRKTIDGLGNTTPEMRRRVYEKARATVSAKLAALNPPPPAAVAERQKKALEDAIAEIEASFPPPPPPPAPDPSDPLAELESVFASLKAKPVIPTPAPASTPTPRSEEPKPWPMTTPKPIARTIETPHVEGPKVEPPAEAPTAETPFVETPPVEAEPEAPEAEMHSVEAPSVEPQAEAPKAEERRAAPPPPPPFIRREEPVLDDDDEPFLQRPAPAEAREAPAVERHETDRSGLPGDDDSLHASPLAGDDRGRHDAFREDVEEQPAPRRRGFGKLITAVLALAVLGGGGYAAWLNKDRILALVKSGEAQLASTAPEEKTGQGVLPPPETPAAPAPSSPEPGAPKFTQRLNVDGTETDAGPAGGEPSVGEGTSVAQVTEPGGPALSAPNAQAPGEAPAEATPPATPGAPAPQPPAAQVAVGQKAIFYEERTSNSPGSAESGSVVWSVVQESPGSDLPPEPAIRGEATIPGKDVQLRMTIRRNADQTLPASHIIELIFLTPDGFGGGGIDNILRFALKSTEEAPGSQLAGIPAKIADGFFLVALNETKQEMETNLNLLRRQNWIDVPVIYKNGRRALITMEKGIPGEKVFEEVMKAWQTASAG